MLSGEKVQANDNQENNNRNRVLINILSEVLEVIDFIVDMEKTKKGYVYFKGDTEDEKQYGINCVEGLFEGLFQTSLASLKFYVSDCRGGTEIREQDSALKQKLRAIRHKEDKPYSMSLGLCEQDTSRLEDFVRNLDGFFLMGEKKRELSDRLSKFIEIRSRWKDRKMPFLLTKDIECYLQCYYDLLLFLLLNENILDEHERLYGLRESLLSTLLRLDFHEEEKNVSFFSPLALNGIGKMYLLVESYYKKIKDDKDDNAVIRFMEKEVIVEKVQHMFRWFFYDESGELAHAAVSPYDEEEEGKRGVEIPCKKIGNYNSYEAVYELRTAEKILYELKNWLDSETSYDVGSSDFNVVLVGDLNKNPVLQLCSYLENVIQGTLEDKEKKKIEKRIKVQLYSKTDFRIEVKSDWNFIQEVKHCGDGDSLFKERALKELMEGSNVIFLLDCVSLYNPVSFELELSPEYYKQRMATSSFSTWLLDNNIDYSSLNCLDELYNCMNIYMRHGHLGKYIKRANETLVSYCQNFYEKTVDLMNPKKRSTLYIYVSDLKAFSRLYNDDNYYMRTERYNQKEIGIIRFTNFKQEPGLGAQHPKIITFNLWQMVKHICIKERRDFISLLEREKLLTDVGEEELQKIHVGIDYSDWENALVLHYYDESHGEGENVRLLENMVVPVLKNGNDLFQQYFQRAVYSFLYGNARTYDDMVFIHLFYNKRELLGKVRAAAKNDSEKVKKNISTRSKYSIKRFVEEGISNLDFAGFNLYDKYFIAGRDRKTLDIIYRNLKNSCEKLGYTDSCLYRNSKAEG